MNTVATTTSFAMAARTVRGGLVTLLGHLRRHIDNWVTAAIARWESQAAAAALRQLSDREFEGYRPSQIRDRCCACRRRPDRNSDDSNRPEGLKMRTTGLFEFDTFKRALDVARDRVCRHDERGIERRAHATGRATPVSSPNFAMSWSWNFGSAASLAGCSCRR